MQELNWENQMEVFVCLDIQKTDHHIVQAGLELYMESR